MGLRNRIFKRDVGDSASATPDDATSQLPAAGAPSSGDTQATMIITPEDQQHAGSEVEAPPPSTATYPAPAESRPGFRERGRMRRRLRYLREVRELGFRDLGGLVFDQHRFQRPNEALVEGKVAAINAADRELRAIGAALDQRGAGYHELFVPGVSACQRCGALHGSDARFCPHCGLSFRGPRAVAGVGVGGETPFTATPDAQAAPVDPQVDAAVPAPPPTDEATGAVTPQATPDRPQ